MKEKIGILLAALLMFSATIIYNGIVKTTATHVQIGTTTADSTLTVTGGAHFTSGVRVDGALLQQPIYGWAGFENQSVSKTLTTQNTWYKVTNATNNLFTTIENSGVSIVNDTIKIPKSGDYNGLLTISASYSNPGDEFQYRIYDILNVHQEGFMQTITSGGNGVQIPLPLPIYITASTNDSYVIEVRNINRNNAVVTFTSGQYNIFLTHP